MSDTFFSRCWNNTDQPISQAANMTTYGSPPSNLSTNIEHFLCTQEEVSYLLTSLIPDKASGPDNISVYKKETVRSIAPSLTRLFNLSITILGYFQGSGRQQELYPCPRTVTRTIHLDTGPYYHCLRSLVNYWRSILKWLYT